MKRFELKKVRAQLNYQSRVEKAGPKKNEPAATAHLTIISSNDLMHMLESKLKESFYRKEIPQDEPVDLADQMAAPKDGLTRLKFSKLQPEFEWYDVFDDYTMVIPYGIDDTTAIKLEGCKVDAFRLTPMEGGSMKTKLNVAIYPDEEQAGKLHTLNGSEITVSLIPPKDGGKRQRDLVEAEAEA